MSNNHDLDLSYEYDESAVNEIVDEAPGSNNFIALRKIRWQPDGEFKWDIRKYFIKADGSEFPGKGITFMTPDGPGNLAEILCENGFGDTNKIVGGICNREDFVDAVAKATAPNADFVHELNEAYKNLEDDDTNKPVNAKEMLNYLL